MRFKMKFTISYTYFSKNCRSLTPTKILDAMISQRQYSLSLNDILKYLNSVDITNMKQSINFKNFFP